jgi:cation diffusion facilitator family transporter
MINISRWQHRHDFNADFSAAEKNTRRVLLLTAVMMVAEIGFGLKFNSLALFADGLHMGTHVAAFSITVLAYFFARRHATDARFSFGTGKFGVLGGFTSAIILGGVGLFMAGDSIARLIHPLPIQFGQAILVACLGLVVNVVSAWMLKDQPHHHHHPGAESPAHGHDDLNLKAAYLHVVADAVTSLLAITALLGGLLLGWNWMDAVMGLVGSAVIAQWSWSLVGQTAGILLDQEPAGSDLNREIRRAIGNLPETAIADLHIWQVGANQFAAILLLVARDPQSPDAYKQLLAEHEELVHVTVEVHRFEEVDVMCPA